MTGSPTQTTTINSGSRQLQRFLQSRLNKPQRHRLLHGFPLAAGMPYADVAAQQLRDAGSERYVPRYSGCRELLIGVLPHSFCTPATAGCGFCTFPHEEFNALRAAAVVRSVIQEIEHRVERAPDLSHRPIRGLYFGGGTANLTPAVPFRQLCRAINTAFRLSEAEISLEGVPAFFVRRSPSLLDILQDELRARHFRISMGIQTFSTKRLEQMGRLAFGTAEVFRHAVHEAQSRGMTTSLDLLFNLPGQTLAEMREDVDRAADLGPDQICLYHLVMFQGLGTPWSRDPQLLASLPDNETAAAHWEWLRQHLLQLGYRQTTLTNFERQELQSDPRQYQYELMSFAPDQFDMLGFGPSGISYAEIAPGSAALKTMNPDSSAEYVQAVHRGHPAWNRCYEYSPDGLQLLHATRQLAALQIDRKRFRQALGCDVCDVYAAELQCLEDADLLTQTTEAVALTPRGMFFADSVAAVLARPHLGRGQHAGRSGDTIRRAHESLNDNSAGHM